MMIKNIKRAVVLGLTALVLFAGMPMPKAMAADQSPAHTQLVVSGKDKNQKVTYRFNLGKSRVTDGRFTVVYDPEVLTLTSQTAKNLFDDYDLNTEYSDGESKGVSYAFVNDDPKLLNGNVLTLTFSVKAGAPNQDTKVKTTVYEINKNETSLASNLVLEDSVNVGRALPQAPTRLRMTQTLLGFALCWQADPNADGYILYRSEGEDGNYVELWETNLTLNYDAYVKNNTTYYYKVASFQKVGDERIVSEPSAPVSGKIKKFFGWFG